MLYILVAVLVYSVLLTAVCLYKDYSGYYVVELIDVIVAGPVCWLVCLLLSIFAPFLRKRKKKRKDKSLKTIKNTVAKVVKEYKEHSKSFTDTEYFNLSSYTGSFDGAICGWKDLLTRKASKEFLNKHFEDLMFHQQDDTLVELKKYFRPLSAPELREVFDPYIVDDIIRHDESIHCVL